MKLKVSQVLGMSALAISLATFPVVLSASAQTTTDGTATDTTTDTAVTDGNYRDGDWGLLGLLGLFGLLGRRSRKHNDEYVSYENRDVVGSSSDRTRY
ncbi:hypothetical protein NUACC21_52660 [Scytonema sp. NUACC21]